MKDTDLLLTRVELSQIRKVWDISAWQPRTNTLVDRINRAQAAKVLAVMLLKGPPARHVARIIQETGLTWPPKEE